MKKNLTLNYLILILLALMPHIMHSQSINKIEKLKVSANGHYLETKSGNPFFWLGDTGWEMLHRLNRDEVDTYLENRSKKGFNVIQTVLVSEFIRMDKPTNFYNDSIFVDENPLKPFITKGNNPEKVTASWFNPRNGETVEIGLFDNSGEKRFEVPCMSKELSWLKSGRGCDWVLIIQDSLK